MLIKYAFFIVATLISFSMAAKQDAPVWDFPVLESIHIGNNCSEDTNLVLLKLKISKDGEIISSKFIKKSSIDKINNEAKVNILALSPFEEFVDMSDGEKEKYGDVVMSYNVPCSNV